MKKLLLLLPALLILSGCHTPERFTQPFVMPAYQAAEAEQEQRAAELSDLLRDYPVAATLINFGNLCHPELFGGDETFMFREGIRRIKLCGFKQLVIRLTSEVQLNDRLRTLLHLAAAEKLKVCAAISQEDFYRVHRANFLFRPLAFKYPDMKKMAELIVKFNAKLPASDRFAGIAVLLLPHYCDGRDAERLYGKLYCWNETDGYGIGNDNDMLMREAYAEAKAIAAIPDLPELTLVLCDFYHDRAAAGQLSVGTIADWAKITPYLSILNLDSRPSGVARGIVSELAAAPEGVEISTLINVAEHTSTGKGALRRRDWRDFIATLRYAAKQAGNYPAFSGGILAPFTVLEMLRVSADQTQLSDKPAEKVDKPADKPAEKVDKPADKPVDKPADKPADKPVDKPADKPADKSAEKTANGK